MKFISKYLVINQNNISTDDIFPAKYLNRTEIDNYGKFVFANNVELNKLFKNSNEGNNFILVSGDFFGCGSSREHAVWALQDIGIKVIIAPSFHPIFHRNMLNNKLIPIIINSEKINRVINTKNNGISPKSIELDLDKNIIENKFFNSKIEFKNNDLRYLKVVSVFDSKEYQLKNLKNIEKHIAPVE